MRTLVEIFSFRDIIEASLIASIHKSILFIYSSSSPPTVIATTTTSETAKKERVIPIQLSSGSPSQILNNDTKEESKVTPISSKPERIIPIKREGEQLQVRKNISGSLVKQLNGSIDTSRPTPISRQGKN